MTALPPQASIDEIADRLVLSRQAIGLGQKDYGERAGIAANTYNQYENGKARPSIDNAIRLCMAHRLTLDWIYLGEPSNLHYALFDAIKAIRAARRGGSGAPR